MTVTISRYGQLKDIVIVPFEASGGKPLGHDHAAIWAGAIVQDIPKLIQWIWNPSLSGVYLSASYLGSPSQVGLLLLLLLLSSIIRMH